MPAIKKRITAEYQKRKQQYSDSEPNGQSSGFSADTRGGLATGDNSNDEEENRTAPPPPPPPPRPSSAAKSGGGDAAVKRKAPVGPKLLKGLDAEVLVEKRKRTVPPSESKLDFWLDENFEKKADCHLSLKKLYQFYTELCQQDETTVPELHVFKHMLVNKFGKEFGFKESSAYSGLLKETKPSKKPKKSVVAASCGYKLKDLIHEALTACGNPAKGMMFSWLKKFIAARYPALQLDVKPQYLRSALQRELTYGRLELVKGIGFCGFYRLPGPPAEDKEKDTKGKKQKVKTEKEADESAEEDDKKSAAKDSAEEKTEEKEKTTTDTEESMEETAAGDEDVKEEETKDKKVVKKKKRQPAKPRWTAAPNHSDPQTLNDIFPLAITYMAEPKEASFTRIRKYLEKYFDKVDIDSRLKRCMEQGIQQGMWERVSGSGASGSFQLKVDSFNPNHTESLTDMVCCAIIACTEPKTSSVRLIKNYITDYHPDFNIDTHPSRLKKALERGENQNQLKRISGIGMSGSFQLVDHFFPSPAILAGDSDDEEDDAADDDGTYEAKGKTEVYVVRQTKSGRKAPIQKTQLDFSATHKKAPSRGSSSKRGASSSKRGKPVAKKHVTAAYDSSSEDDLESEVSSEEEENSENEAVYKPRPSKSRGGGGGGGRGAAVAKKTPPAKKKAAAPSPAKGRKAARGQKGNKSSAVATPPPASHAKKGSRKTTPAKSAKRQPLPAKGKAAEEDEEEEEEEEVYRPAVATPKSAKKRPMPASRKAASEDEEEEEEEVYTPKSTKHRSLPASRKMKEEEEEDDSPPPPPSSRRSAPIIAKKSAPTAARSSRGARISYTEDDDVDDEDDEEDFAPPRKATPGKRNTPSNSARKGSGGRRVEM